MIIQIKKYGNSKVIKLSPEFLKYMGLEEGDWINMSDVFKVVKK